MEMTNELWISKLGRNKPALDDRLVLYCRSGRRSNLASQEAIELKYSR
jgi:rhodanese-related sulfurtransferase